MRGRNVAEYRRADVLAAELHPALAGLLRVAGLRG